MEQLEEAGVVDGSGRGRERTGVKQCSVDTQRGQHGELSGGRAGGGLERERGMPGSSSEAGQALGGM